MAHVLIMPRQGNTVESCIIQEWKVKEGDSVGAETTVCVVETDKATFDIPAGAAGSVLKILRPGGDDVPVLAEIAVIGAAGEDWQAALSPQSAPPAPEPRIIPPVELSPGARDNSSAGVSPRARNAAAKARLPLEGVSGSGPQGRVIERDVNAVLESGPFRTAAALAAGPAAAPEKGSGMGGRLTLDDLSGAPALQTAEQPAAYSDRFSETPVKGIRKLIADRMLDSLLQSAQFTLNASAPAAAMQKLRKKIKASGADGDELGIGKITVNDIVLFAVSRTLTRFPFMNAHKTGDMLKTFERVHLGLAVDTPRGLMVPVIRNADLLSLRKISAEAKRLAAACQAGTITPDELSASTFTVTNLGSFGVSSFTPVINTPEVAILGVCGIEYKPVSKNDDNDVDFAPHIGFSLTINHQVIDGAPAARFLKALCDALADIELLLAAA
ncbi:MAG: 2-oxo acid dehydrogenase subunit E2 [Treponema sp.]|jgi:pyruvate dehydrogenase E2 component (dihydrolipoamide acetyltransferase)|nr:2-oxo acid dehydrogenase subunit E2 [Treponema sp.]